MRDNVHQSRNKIAKSIGVLVVAALVAVLGLPTAAQAQEISGIGKVSRSSCQIPRTKVSWRHGACAARVNGLCSTAGS